VAAAAARATLAATRCADQASACVAARAAWSPRAAARGLDAQLGL
jgi:hypothetical protein